MASMMSFFHDYFQHGFLRQADAESNMYSVKRTDELVTIFKKQQGDIEVPDGRLVYSAKTGDLIVIDGIGPYHVGEMDDEVLVRQFRQPGGIVPLEALIVSRWLCCKVES
jgi:hypothetical protein